MKLPRQEKTVVDLRGVRTDAQEYVESLRKKARESWEVEEPKEKNKAINVGKAWNDIFGGVFRVASISLVIMGSWTYLPSIAVSLSYFTDTEGSVSHMATGFIDLVVSPELEVTELTCGGMEDPEVHVETFGNTANVSASTTGVLTINLLQPSL